MAREKTRGHDRTRHWTFLVYPESAPENWRDVLDDLHIPWVESPLHDKDTDPDGEIKKEHWHVVLMFDNVKSFEQIKAICDGLNAPIPQKCHSAKGAVRYMAHMDNPDKFQYPVSEIKAHGGADLAELLKPTSAARYQLIKEMIAYIRTEGVTEFVEFADYASAERFDDWFPLICDNSAFLIREVINSNRNKRERSNAKA